MNSRSIKVILFVTTLLFFVGIGWAIFATVTNRDDSVANNNSHKQPANNDNKSSESKNKSVKKPAENNKEKVSIQKKPVKNTPTNTYTEYYIVEYYEVEALASASASASASGTSAHAEANAW